MTSASDRASELLKAERPHEAREVLLMAGYIEGDDDRARAMFLSHFPPEGVLAEMLNTVYREIQSPSAATRLRAMRQLRNEMARQSPRGRHRWMRDPRASGPITAALDDDDPKVVRDAMHALTHLSRRYFPDLRAREPLRKKVMAKDSTVRVRAGEALAYLRDEVALEYLVPLLLDKVEDVRHRAYKAVGAVVYEFSPLMTGKQLKLGVKARQAWQERMELALAGPDYLVREFAAGILAAIGGNAVLPILERALETETVEHARDGIGLVIKNTRDRLARE